LACIWNSSVNEKSDLFSGNFFLNQNFFDTDSYAGVEFSKKTELSAMVKILYAQNFDPASISFASRLKMTFFLF
jgi:hypothetical protein